MDAEKTGWPPGMLQDDSRELSRWLAGRPDARRVAREVALTLEEARRVYLADPTRLNLAALAVIFEGAPDSVETAGKQEA
jgi:hypothetical protein